MLGFLFAAFIAFTLFSYFILKPIVDYFRDPKGLRRYPSLNRFSAFTDLAFMWEAHQGFRSKKLLELHKTHPVVRIGPNSLSYGDVRAIKVRVFIAIHLLILMLMLSRMFMDTTRSASKTFFTPCYPEHIITWPMWLISQNMHGNERSYPAHTR